MMKLEDKVAIVTGGSHGIGRAYCQGLAKEGAKIVIADVDHTAAEETKRLVERDGGSALAIKVDVTNEGDTIGMAEATVKAYGKIDILINNAAMLVFMPISRDSFDEIPLHEWDRVMLVNLKGTWLCCRAVVPYMKKQKSGKIINISSGSTFSGVGRRIHYTTSKSGLLGFTRTLARELGDFGITVNTVAPGAVLSEDNRDMRAAAQRGVERAVEPRCLKRVQVPEDLLGPIVFLCSNDSDFMTGQTMIVDGGTVMI